ncbi:MAG: hypothetical protein IJN50_00415 [Clostridia bacterium]|nr:hypothetical protein [Clostridia bacterium]
MTNQEKNNKLFEEYKKKTYEELDELESKSDITYNDYVILCIARGVKQIEDGIPGIPADEVFSELLGDYNDRANNTFTTSKNRLNKY